MAALLHDGSLRAVELPPVGSPEECAEAWNLDCSEFAVDTRSASLFTREEELFVVDRNTVLTIGVQSGEVLDEPTILPAKGRSQCLARDCLWVLLRNDTVLVLDLLSGESTETTMPQQCTLTRLWSSGEDVFAYGATLRQEGGICSFVPLADGQYEPECILRGNVQRMCVGRSRPRPLLAITRDGNSQMADLMGAESETFVSLAQDEIGSGAVYGVFPAESAFVIVMQGGTIYERSYDHRIPAREMHKVDGHLVLPVTVCDGVVCLTARGERGRSSTTGVRLEGGAKRRLEAWRQDLPAIEVVAASSEGHFYFVDRNGMIHRVRAA